MTISGEIGVTHWNSLQLLLPGRAVGLYLIGSAASGDFQPTSNIDTITVLDGVLDAGDQQLLRGVHADIHAAFPETVYDTTYVLREWLPALPPVGTAAPLPFTVEGHLRLGERSPDLHPLSWMILAHGTRQAGPQLDDLGLVADAAAALAYAEDQLHHYWAAVGAELSLATRWRRPRQVLDEPEAIIWTVLGLPRLVAFVETGRLISKSEAGAMVGRRLPEYAELAGRCLARRRGEKPIFTHADLKTTAALVRRLLADVAPRESPSVTVVQQVGSAAIGDDPAITGEPPEERAPGLLALQ